MATKTQSLVAAERSSLIFEGVLAILFGIAAVFWPGLTIGILVYLVAAFLLGDGLAHLIFGLLSIRHLTKSLLLLGLGLIQVGVSVFLFRHPDVVFETFILILGFSLIVRGLFALVHLFTGDEYVTIRTMHAIMGALGLIVGVIVLMQPVAGGIAFVWVLGLYALISGPVLLAMSADVGKTQKG